MSEVSLRLAVKKKKKKKIGDERISFSMVYGDHCRGEIENEHRQMQKSMYMVY